MPPANNQLCTWNDIAAEVTAGRMAWSGAAQSGNGVVTWASYTSNVLNDGTNPSNYANNQCAPYSYLLAHAITVQPPTNVVIVSNGDGTCTVTWNNPTTGETPDGYKVQFKRNGVNLGTLQTIAYGTTTANSPANYVLGDSAEAWIYSYKGTSNSSTVTSNNITV